MTTLRRVQPGLYRTTDGRYEVSYEEWWLDNECGCAICESGAPGCPNDGFGKRSGWTVFDVAQNNHVSGEPFEFQTYREAREYLLEVVLGGSS